MTTLTRGPLPARVYWRRRIVVLGTALALVVGIAQLLGRGSDGSSGPDDSARLAGAPTRSATPSPDTTSATSPAATRTARPTKPTPTPSPTLAAPSGPCDDADIAVTPAVARAVAGPRHGVDLVLRLRTITAEACTWTVSPRTLTLKITSGRDAIWSSRDCPRALPATQVTVRRAADTTVPMHWNARRSDEGCPARTDWALPGWYHVKVAALGGEPADVQFELLAPTAPQVTITPSPKQQGKASASASPKATRKPKPSQQASPQPGER